MLRKIRITIASLFFGLITLMFLDFTGVIHLYLGWMAKIQLLPAIMAMNVGIVVVLLLLTFIFGRFYCSIICPLGVMQDIFSYFGGKVWKRRFHYVKNRKWLRFSVAVVFVLMMVLGLNAIAVLIAPYSAYGRIATYIFQPIYMGLNNICAFFAERWNSYAFYHVDVWVKSGIMLVVAIVTFVLIGFLAFRYGRVWCNNICPVGSLLGLISNYSLFRMQIDASKCVGCTLCARQCKASCINPKTHEIDASRCVGCMDCLDNCTHGAISYSFRKKKKTSDEVDSSKRKFIITSAVVGAGMAVEAQEKKVDGGMAIIEDKKVMKRNTPLKPAGAISLKNFSNNCTSCQLCVSECPNQVLRPSMDLKTFMQPEMGFEKGYCRPECTRCSEVCPAGAIIKIDRAEKSGIRIGHAVWVRENCLMPQGVSCGLCERNCPAGAIILVDDAKSGFKIPSVNESYCIGCGKCENLCPVRPFSAIYVEGHSVHMKF